MAWPTTVRTWLAGEKLTATLMNEQIRDALKAISDPWTAYTPTWTASSVNPTLGNGTLVGSYVKAGRLVIGDIRLTIGSTTTVGTGSYSFGLPFAQTNTHKNIGDAEILDLSIPTPYMRHVFANGAQTVALVVEAGTPQAGAASPVVPAAGDIYAIQYLYMATS